MVVDMPPRTRKRTPDYDASKHIAAAHGHEETKLIADTLRLASEWNGTSPEDRTTLVVIADEYDRANAHRHLFLRGATLDAFGRVKP